MGLLASFVASWFLAARLAEPLRKAMEGLSRLRDGDHSYRIDYPNDDELGALCGTIDELSRRIHKAHFLGYLWAAPPQDKDREDRS
jgi:methyl-accepting chemotaxis protein